MRFKKEPVCDEENLLGGPQALQGISKGEG